MPRLLDVYPCAYGGLGIILYQSWSCKQHFLPSGFVGFGFVLGFFWLQLQRCQSRDREGRGGGSRREVALQQLPAGVLGHMGCLQCPVPRDRKYRVVLALPDSPNVPVAQCDPFIPPQQDKGVQRGGSDGRNTPGFFPPSLLYICFSVKGRHFLLSCC